MSALLIRPARSRANVRSAIMRAGWRRKTALWAYAAWAIACIIGSILSFFIKRQRPSSRANVGLASRRQSGRLAR